MKKKPLDEGEVWVVKAYYEALDGYGISIVDAISPRNFSAITFYIKKPYVIMESDVLVVLSSAVDGQTCEATLLNFKTLEMIDIVVTNCSTWKN